ncbi:DNA primase [Sphingobium sp. DEHP117]|uniref:DNA primase n=1 Tax=Sphingobium sp. DEHP117 TaxID=2993436 RepID=UPI0027D5CDEA|nr:DNA primase [Sphingobium sp. DEHP117]MDQ4419875.1 DNA primase [Sphingobium sp. DEHP117]
MSLSPQFLDELRARTTLSTLIGKSVKVSKAGREYKACCPFHNEKTPSFTINDEKGFYHCFGCGAHGDAIRWMTDQRGLPFMDAVKELADAAGLEVPAPDPRAAKKAEAAKGLHEACAAAQDWFETQLGGLDGAEARAYLEKRGISDATRRAFGFGYAPDSRGKLKTALRDFPEALLIEAGLLIKPEDKGREAYDRFRGRLMIPIRDARGRVIAFGGRILSAGEPKYLNSPDTPLFDKGRTLYNIDKALPAARAAGRIIVVEGYMDVIALAQAGIHECVAPLGTALTEHQIERLWKMVDVPILCFDGDSAGQKAADRAALRALPLLQPGRSLSFVTLPGGMDPDDLVKAKGAAGFEACVASPTPLVERLWRHEHEAAPAATPEARAGLQQRLNEHAATISNDLVRREYERALKDRFWAEFGWKKQERSAVRGFINRSREEIRGGDLGNMGARIERMVKRAVLLGLSRYPAVLYSHREQIGALAMPTDTLKAWASLLVRASFERATLETSLIDSILLDASLPETERRDIAHDLGFSFFRADADRQLAENDLGEVINLLLFEQEFAPKLEGLKTALYARSEDNDIDEASWQEHLALIKLKHQNDERLRELKANIEEQLMAA